MEFNNGEKIKLEGGQVITIANPSGDWPKEGGQGFVYIVELSGGCYSALKWYKPSYLKGLSKNGNLEYFKENLKENIGREAPSNKFIWPKAITEDKSGSFGYIMSLKPNDYTNFEDIYLKRTVFASFKASIDCAINMVDAFRTLHKKGFFYLDLNDGNFFINPINGDVLVCDNDNVTANPKFNIGKPGYVAPELVRGDEGVLSSDLTDSHSLAVVLFKLLIRHDPMEGVKFVTAGMLSPKKQRELYGTNPVFIYDENDKTNRPVNGLHLNALNLWTKYPEYLRDAFTKTFSAGLNNPRERITELEWKKILLRIRDSIIFCPCGKDIYLYLKQENQKITCSCGKVHNYPRKMELNESVIYLFPGNSLLGCHLDGNDEDCAEVGKVVASKSDQQRWGLKNLSSTVWKVTKSTGESEEVNKDGIVVIEKGAKIEFNSKLSATIM